MTIEKKKLYSYPEVTTSELADKIPTLQGGVNKVTTLQKIYNLFKSSFDSVYTTASAVGTQISSALTDYATKQYVTDEADEAENNANLYTDLSLLSKQDKQLLNVVDIDASGVSEIEKNSCILSITNLSVGNQRIIINIRDNALNVGDVISTSVIYGGFDVSLLSWEIVDDGVSLTLSLYVTIHSSPEAAVLIAINKIN